MNKIKFSIIVLAIATIGIIFTSCQKEEQVFQNQETETTLEKPLLGVENCNATIKNGYISFKTVADVNAYYKYLETHSDDDIDAMETQNNFISFDRKIESILREYEILNENENTTMNEIIAFRAQYKQYITITDEDYFPNIDGISNRLINSEGYLQVGEDISKYVKQNIYTTNIDNINLLETDSFSNELISKSEVKITEIEPTTTGRISSFYNTGAHNASQYDKRKCRRWHKTTSSVRYFQQFRFSGYQTGTATASVGYRYYLKNMKRGWTGIWYGQSRSSRNQGNYQSAYNGSGSYNHYNNSVSVSRTYNAHWWWTAYDNGYYQAYQWAIGQFSTAYGWVEGTVTYDVCGTRTWSY